MSEHSFISQRVMERLESGSFQAHRRTKPGSLTLTERRDTISPLSVTKRCVRYDPHVFDNRRELIVKMAHALNNEQKKLILLSGPQGCGKTSLARGIIELMGGGQEQLLWFDVNQHTDFDDIIHFLIQYITYLCSALRLQETKTPQNLAGSDPFERLEQLILGVENIPLLIVLDNVEHIVNREYQIRSHPLKEILNFLLSFDNIKMILAGERMPYADMSSTATVVEDIRIGGLPESVVIPMLQKQKDDLPTKPSSDPLKPGMIRELYYLTEGYPWLLKVLLYMTRHGNASLNALYDVLKNSKQNLNEFQSKRPDIAGVNQGANQGDNTIADITRFIYHRLSPEEQTMAHILCFLRHPADLETLIAISRYCKPELGFQSDNTLRENLRETLDHSILKPLMKRTFPPQLLLEAVRNRSQTVEVADVAIKPWYEFYRQIKKVLYQNIPVEERNRIHGQLQEFYLKEKNTPPENRVYAVNAGVLTAEAKHHANAARRRKSPQALDNNLLEAKSYLSPFTATAQTSQKTSAETPNAFAKNAFSEAEMINTEKRVTTNLRAGEPPVVISQAEADFLSEVELTPEERALIYGSDTTSTIVQNSKTTAASPKEKADEMQDEMQDKSNAERRKSPHRIDDNSFTDSLSKLSATPETTTGTDPVERQIQQQLAAAVANQNKQGMLKHLLALARYRSSKGLFRNAEECLEKALHLRDVATPTLLADIYGQLGSIHKETFRHNSALDYLNRGILALVDNPDVPTQLEPNTAALAGKLYQDLAGIHAYREQHSEAIAAYYRALDYYSQTSDLLRMAETYFQLAQVYDAMGMSENALTYYEQGLTLDKQQENWLSCAATLANMGSVHMEQGQPGDYHQALKCFRESLHYDRRGNNGEGMFNTLDLVATCLMNLREWKKAENSYQQALTIAVEENNPTWQASVYLKIGNLYRHLGNWPQALSRYQQAAVAVPASELSERSRSVIDSAIAEAKIKLQEQGKVG